MALLGNPLSIGEQQNFVHLENRANWLLVRGVNGLNFTDILHMRHINRDEIRMVRHGKMEIDPLAVFRSDRKLFEAYQSFQQQRKFGDAKRIACFAPHHGTQALFLGIWSIRREVFPATAAPTNMKTLIAEYVADFDWPLDKNSYYELQPDDALADLSERVVIEWGSPRSWVQSITDKTVVSILPENAVDEFRGFEHTILSFEEMQKILRNPASNRTWHSALSSVNGVYCITDGRNGKHYVGRAYGHNGIWGRWEQYANSRHGGNLRLIAELESDSGAYKHFQFSVLEVFPSSYTASEAENKEQLWKLKLGSRVHGYNEN